MMFLARVTGDVIGKASSRIVGELGGEVCR
jgi:hypothetical protein